MTALIVGLHDPCGFGRSIFTGEMCGTKPTPLIAVSLLEPVFRVCAVLAGESADYWCGPFARDPSARVERLGVGRGALACHVRRVGRGVRSDLWAKAIEPRIALARDRCRVVLVNDLYYRDEAAWVREQGGLAVKLELSGAPEPLYDCTAEDPSEAPTTFDHILHLGPDDLDGATQKLFNLLGIF